MTIVPAKEKIPITTLKEENDMAYTDINTSLSSGKVTQQ